MRAYLTKSQLDKLSDILINMGTVLFASVVVSFLLRIGVVEAGVFFAGLLLTFLCWSASILVVRRKR